MYGRSDDGKLAPIISGSFLTPLRIYLKRGGLRNLGPVDEELLRVETGRVTVEPTVATECCRGKDR